jgi:hypothetical protein
MGPARLCSREAEDKNVGMLRLPSMKIDKKSADPLAAFFPSGTNQIEKFLSFGACEKRGINKFSDPIHLVCVREIKRNLNIFIGIFDKYDAVVINISVLPFTFEENGTALLHLRRMQLRLFEKRNHICVGQRLNGRGKRFAFRGFCRNRTAGEGNRAEESYAPVFHTISFPLNRSAVARGLARPGPGSARVAQRIQRYFQSKRA